MILGKAGTIKGSLLKMFPTTLLAIKKKQQNVQTRF